MTSTKRHVPYHQKLNAEQMKVFDDLFLNDSERERIDFMFRRLKKLDKFKSFDGGVRLLIMIKVITKFMTMKDPDTFHYYLDNVIMECNLESIEYYITRSKAECKNYRGISKSDIATAGLNGMPGVFEYCYENRRDKDFKLDPLGVLFTIRGGNMDSIRYAFKHSESAGVPVVLLESVEQNLECVKLCFENRVTAATTTACEIDNCILRIAAKSHDFELFKWCFEHRDKYYDGTYTCIIDRDIVLSAMYPEVKWLKFLYENRDPKPGSYTWIIDSHIFMHHIKEGNKDCIEFCRKHYTLDKTVDEMFKLCNVKISDK